MAAVNELYLAAALLLYGVTLLSGCHTTHVTYLHQRELMTFCITTQNLLFISIVSLVSFHADILKILFNEIK